MNLLKKSLISCCMCILLFSFSSCSKRNPFIGEWRISRFVWLDDITPTFQGKFNPLYKGYFYIKKDGSLSFYVALTAITGSNTRIDNDGYWEFKDGKLYTFLKDQDNGGYVKGTMKITDGTIIYEVDGTVAGILVKE